MCLNDFCFCIIVFGREWYISDWIYFRMDGRWGVYWGIEVIIVVRFIYCKWLGWSIGDGSYKSVGLIIGFGVYFLKVLGNLMGMKLYIVKLKL